LDSIINWDYSRRRKDSPTWSPINWKYVHWYGY